MAKEYRNQSQRRSHDFVFWTSLPFAQAPSNIRTTLRFTLTTSSGKRTGNLFLEKCFGGRSPQTLLLRMSHLLLGCNNCRLSIREKGESFFLGAIEPRESHKFDSRLILIKLLRYVNYEIRHSWIFHLIRHVNPIWFRFTFLCWQKFKDQ